MRNDAARLAAEAAVLILIILEVLYEIFPLRLLQAKIQSLNPYYTGSTL